jgi:DNA-directed RNA polymerase specialized sigma subunit
MEKTTGKIWEKGITAERLIDCISMYENDIRSFVIGKLLNQSGSVQQFINRKYGSHNEFFKELKQQLVFELLNKLNDIQKNCELKHIFWEIRKLLGKMLYAKQHEIYDFEIIINDKVIGSYLENYPDETCDLFEKNENQTKIQSYIGQLNHVSLSEMERNVLQRKYFDNDDYEEICKKYHISYSKATNHHENALRKIRAYFILHDLNYEN